MAHTNTVLSQLLKLVPRHDFEQLAESHHCGQKFRKTSRWSQFVALTLGQLSGCVSLRDTVENLNVQSRVHYHLGIKSVARSTLSRVNREQSYELYEALFSRLLQRCQAHAKVHGLRFKQRLISLDASLIDLSPKHIQWATYTPTKCAMKLHVGLDHGGYLPVYAAVTHGQTSDLAMARQFKFKPGDVLVMDRGYTQHAFYKSLTDQGVFFVTRLQRGIPYEVVQEQTEALQPHVVADRVIRFTSLRAQRAQSTSLRLVTYRDPQTGREYEFLTNHFDLSAGTIAACYKARWQVELFFRWIKQNLKLKAFVGDNYNAIMTQIWIALCTYLVLWFLHAQSQTQATLRHILRVLRNNLFTHRSLMELIGCDPPGPEPSSPQAQMVFA